MTEHVYLSTGCLHGEHDYCKNKDGMAGPKEPASCKFCGARCVCDCHLSDNVGLVNFYDDAALLAGAIKYLEVTDGPDARADSIQD